MALVYYCIYTRRLCITEFRPEFSEFSKIPVYFRTGILNFDYFRTGVSNSSFGKIFGKFREIFGRSKPLFYFGPVSDFEIPENPKYRESRKAEIFFQTHGLNAKKRSKSFLGNKTRRRTSFKQKKSICL